jgi:hypothetical protein
MCLRSDEILYFVHGRFLEKIMNHKTRMRLHLVHELAYELQANHFTKLIILPRVLPSNVMWLMNNGLTLDALYPSMKSLLPLGNCPQLRPGFRFFDIYYVPGTRINTRVDSIFQNAALLHISLHVLFLWCYNDILKGKEGVCTPFPWSQINRIW